jgi:hypothetical protein
VVEKCEAAAPPSLRQSSDQPGKPVEVPGGTVFVESLGADRRSPRALFVPARSMGSETEPELAMYAAQVAFEDKRLVRCTYGAKAIAFPLRLKPRVVVDARLQYVAADWNDKRTRSVTVYDLSWRETRQDPPEAGLRQRWVSTDRYALKAFNDEFPEYAATSAAAIDKAMMVKSVHGWREPGGFGFWFGGLTWRIVERGLEPLLDADHGSVQWQTLSAENASSQCDALRRHLAKTQQAGFTSVVRGFGERCVQIGRGPDPNAPSNAGSSGRDIVFVNLYDALNESVVERLGDNLPAAVASFEPFPDRIPSTEKTDDWVIGVAKPFEGWIGLRMSGGGTRLWAAPLTTEALLSLGAHLCDAAVATPSTSAASDGAGTVSATGASQRYRSRDCTKQAERPPAASQP